MIQVGTSSYYSISIILTTRTEMREGEERQRDRETKRQRSRETDRQRDRQSQRERERERGREGERVRE